MTKYDKENPLRVFTAFSGYDSQCLALERVKQKHAGFDYELVGWSEIDKFAIMAHDVLFPHAADRNCGDISKVDWAQVPDFDLFTMSSPCQDFSIAGKQAGGEEGSGTRSSLLWECKRAIAVKKPRYVIFENVSAVVSKKFKPGFLKWVHWLQDNGYKNFWQVLNASDYGVPQHRQRIFMVSILDPAAHFEFPKPFPLERRLKHLLHPFGTVPEEYYLKPKQVQEIVRHCAKKQAQGCGFKPNFADGSKISGTNLCKYGSRQTDTYIKEQPPLFDSENFTMPNAENKTDALGEARVLQVGNIGGWRAGRDAQEGRYYSTEGISPTIIASRGPMIAEPAHPPPN